MVRYAMRLTPAWLRDLPIGKKLLVSFGLVFFLLGLSLTAILFYLASINSYVERHHRITVPALATAAGMRQQSSRMSLALALLLNSQSKAAQTETIQRLAALDAEIRSTLNLYEAKHAARTHPVLFGMLTRHGQTSLAAQEDAVLEEAIVHLDQLRSSWHRVVESAQTGRVAEAHRAFAQTELLSRKLSGAFSALIQVNTKIAAEMKAEGDSLLYQATLVTLALIILLVLVTIGTYWIVRSHIAQPLRTLAYIADRVAHHDLSAQFDPWPTRDEVGALTSSLSAMLENIRERTLALERKTRELESFTSSVAHDLKGPLREIEGFSALLDRKFADTLEPTARHYLATIRISALRLTALIDALLRYSRLEQQTLPKAEMNVRTMMNELVAEHARAAKGRPLEIKVDLPFTTLWGETTSIRQALINLIGNAIKFSRSSLPQEVSIGGTVHGGERVLWVRDNGIGFDLKESDRIFGLFERLHGSNEYEGTGVGLAIVKLVMDKHGGRVWAESSPGKGSVFYLAFPDVREDVKR